MQHYDTWNKIERLSVFSQEIEKRLLRKHGVFLDRIIKEIFDKLPVSAAQAKLLKKISVFLITKNMFPPNMSGVVIAGFGNFDIYPSLCAYKVEGVIENIVKHVKSDESVAIGKSDNITASIVPFAQSDVVQAFIQGIDPSFNNTSLSLLSNIFSKYPGLIVEKMPELKDELKREIFKRELESATNSIFEAYLLAMKNNRSENQINPILAMVASFPKDELAIMAETLVNLTSFKRRITNVKETVGGPIDVAVITKGDGFIWIKRKCYFKTDLNEHFYKNYQE